jgi:hypothetical protein
MAKSKAAKAGAAAAAARNNPYLQRLVEDDDLRENIRTAYESARTAYARLNNGKGPAKVVIDDKKFQKNVKQAANALRDAGEALREGPKKRRGGIGRKLLFLMVAGGLALALSEGLRKTVLDTLFGKEEEFEYTSTTTPTPEPAAASTS